MAEGILFDLAGKLLEGLGSLAAEELEAALGLKEEMEKLPKTGSAIRAVLRDAEDQRNRNNHQVRLWLENLKDVLYDVEDLLDEFTCDALRQKIVAGDGKPKKVRLFFSTSNQLAYGLKMAPKVKAIRERLDAIAADKANFQLSDCPVETPIEVRERDQTYSFELSEEIIGRDYDKNKIVRLLLKSEPEQNVSIVPIIGIGGLGKTTLAKMVFNDEKLGDHFELKMWVCVSEKFELKVIVEKVIEAATKTKPERDLQLETLQHHLRDSIKRKKYLLVLDDVWNDDPEKWRNLRNLLSGGARGSWIVVTTRNKLVADITGTVSPHNLRGLSRSESWSLLKQTAFKEESRESNNSRIEAIGMEIVDKCKGVPLALRAIGKVLYKRTEAEWVKVNKNVHKYLTHEEEGIMPILKLSYDHLPSHLKQCFAYCSLVPKDTSFSVPMLIQLWMALGFVQPLSEDEDLEDTGYEYFKDLVWRSFIDCESMDYLGKSWFTMHDLMHDLACSVAGKEYCIVSLEEENVSERSRHVSFDNSSAEMGNTLLKATKVRSFAGNMDLPLYQQNYMASIANYKYLRMLNLSGSDIKMLPHSIGNLKHLKALYLSGNRYLLKLPSSLSRLQLLETLDLNGCSNFRTLPNKTSRLVSLKHLVIDGCHKLDYMPRGLGKLTRLQTLRWFVVGRTTGKNVGQLSELNGLNKLKGELHILGLQNAIAKHGSTYLKDKLNLKSLVLGWGCRGGEDETVLECIQPHPNLEKLSVIGYPGSKMSSWLSSVTNLSELILYGFANCQHLQPLHQLYSLKVIRLSRLEALEIVSETEMQEELVSGKSTTTFLPSLEELEINDCPNLKGWWKGDVGEASNPHLPCFPCLSHLIIKHCPNLTTMPLFPSVKTLKLKNTSSKPFQETMKLKMTKIEAPSLSTLHPLSKLVSLEIDEVKDLHSLQEEFLQNLTSLQTLMIRECINLTSMPEGMPGLTSLNHLEIIDCPQLSKRCQRNTGLDWPKIAHIERIRIEEGGIVEHYRGSRAN
ncbi:disease resistance protein RGA2-like isoform X2 [Gossypium arboreum]|uniref:disease resistance protein RGA2-like isoform X2 n=1 Tax=Gossypium arboreum TaxID=29729 RepID=UPI0022F17388|nr:disease resistance protein RGA2-like isoform X2 [Gossypium arboreum]